MMNTKNAFNLFYGNVKVNFKMIDDAMLEEIAFRAQKINKLYNCEHFRKLKGERYIKIMEMIGVNYREGIRINSEYATISQAEKFLLFIFSVDPDFKAAIISGSEDRTSIIKEKMISEFGVYDLGLIKIENFVIKHVLDKKKSKEIFEEIDRRAYK